MNLSLDPLRLRFLLERLHSEFPAVNYNSLVRAVMQVECTTHPTETLEAYSHRVREALQDGEESPGPRPIRRTARIFCRRSLPEDALIAS